MKQQSRGQASGRLGDEITSHQPRRSAFIAIKFPQLYEGLQWSRNSYLASRGFFQLQAREPERLGYPEFPFFPTADSDVFLLNDFLGFLTKRPLKTDHQSERCCTSLVVDARPSPTLLGLIVLHSVQIHYVYYDV